MTMLMKVVVMRGMVRLLEEMVGEDDDRKCYCKSDDEWKSMIRMSVAYLTLSGEVVGSVI